jgi:hypothetical protein
MEREGLIGRGFEGHRVDVTFHDGRTIEDCLLVSSTRRRIGSLWLVVDDADLFVPTNEVVALAVSRAHAHGAAA